MFVIHKCRTCGEECILNVRTRIGSTRKRTRLKNVNITEVIDKEDFINNTLRPAIIDSIDDGKTINELKLKLQNEYGLNYGLTERVINALKAHPFIKVVDNKFVYADPAQAQII